MPKRTKLTKSFHWFRRSIYAFPLVVILIFILLTAFKLNGSSIGIYHSLLYGSKASDSDLIYGKPKSIRSDEWKVGSPLSVLQYKTDFPVFNQNLGSGRDVSILPDAPTKDWVTAFRPQNWAFFILPFEYAFAYKWWLGLFLLIISAYFFALKNLNKNKSLSILVSLAFAFSPFLLWWYQTSLFFPMAYSFMIMILGIRIIKQEKIPLINSKIFVNLIYIAALAYLISSFGLFLYAPFLIAIALVVCAFLLGYLINERFGNHLLTTKDVFLRTGLLLSPLIIVALILFGFVVGHKDMITKISGSAYPGHRVVESGSLNYSPAYPILGSYLMPLIQSDSRATHYIANQSEASNFILLLPFLILPGVFLQIIEYKTKKKVDFILIAINALAILFLLRISIHFGDGFYKLLLLDKVPNNRLLAGIGLLGFLQLIYTIKIILRIKFNLNKKVLASIYGLVCFFILIIFSIYVKNRYPIFLNELLSPIFFALIFSSIIFTLLLKRIYLALILLLVFTFISSVRILPIYHGAKFFINSAVINSIEQISNTKDSWVVLDSQNYESLPQIAGRRSIGGAQIYTDLNFWHQLDKSGQYQYVYNRQAHAIFLSNTLKPDPTKRFNVSTVENNLELVKSNLFKVKFTCSNFTYTNIDYVLITHPIEISCIKLIKKIDYPKSDFYIYKVVKPVQ